MSPTWKKRLWLYATFALILLAAYWANTAIQSHLGRKALQATGLKHYDLEEAMTLAASQSKMVLADLSAIWCPSCRKLDKEVFADPDVGQLIEQKFIFARIEYESTAGQEFKKKYKTRGFPTLLILDSDGNLVKRLPLTFNPREFMQTLSQI